ncbi:hypothetical protein K470DRAFT_262005 [Piedraia hortae CBS 480.64]|uniref:Uncharacterized protein n=1 Tax=Piedraia hortae CBS 480.64 TaxID=1314780 RepID=A0A6A7CAJ2_9PEZI|nr:hypothetical protein K470DRAFT_262005 [Piedraia hortae CBS 480.64]
MGSQQANGLRPRLTPQPLMAQTVHPHAQPAVPAATVTLAQQQNAALAHSTACIMQYVASQDLFAQLRRVHLKEPLKSGIHPQQVQLQSSALLQQGMTENYDYAVIHHGGLRHPSIRES